MPNSLKLTFHPMETHQIHKTSQRGLQHLNKLINQSKPFLNDYIWMSNQIGLDIIISIIKI